MLRYSNIHLLMARIILVLMLISISTLARASDWKYLGTDTTGDDYYIDAESISIEGDTRTFWFYKRFNEPRAVNNKLIYALKSQSSINCTKRTHRPLIGQTLDSKGNQVQYGDYRSDLSDVPIIPDSSEDMMRKYVCSIKKDANTRATDWKYITTNVDGDWYIDSKSLLIEGDTRTYWRYVKFKEPKTIEDITFSALKSQQTINCIKRTTIFLTGLFLDSQDNAVGYSDASPSTSSHSIVPDSVDDVMRKYVCSIKKSAE